MARNPLSDWQLERLAAGDLPADEAAALRRRLEEEPGGSERLAAIEASNRAILAKHPPARVAAAVRARAETERAPRRLPRGFSLALAAPALAVFLVVFLQHGGTPDGGGLPAEVIRLKGAAPKLLVHRSESGTPVQLADGAPAHARDLLQLSYQAAGSRWGAVISIDGNGNVMQHLPDAGPTAARLDPNGAVSLPQSYELDDAPAFERFVLVTSDEPFSLEPVLDAARWLSRSSDPQRGELPLPPALHQTSFLVRKVP